MTLKACDTFLQKGPIRRGSHQPRSSKKNFKNKKNIKKELPDPFGDLSLKDPPSFKEGTKQKVKLIAVDVRSLYPTYQDHDRPHVQR